jgi:hypothetical protein
MHEGGKADGIDGAEVSHGEGETGQLGTSDCRAWYSLAHRHRVAKSALLRAWSAFPLRDCEACRMTGADISEASFHV